MSFCLILKNGGGVGGNKVNNRATSDFLNCCKAINVFDLKSSGPKYTWTNKRKGNHKIKEKIDRFLASASWSHLFP